MPKEVKGSGYTNWITPSINRFFLLVAISVTLFAFGCKDSGVIGLDVQPDSDIVNGLFNDTTTVIAYTERADSLRSDEPILCLLGAYTDPIFGKAQASFYTMFSMPVNNVSFGSGFTPDSLVLTIPYTGYYGDPPTAQTVFVHRVLDTIVRSSAYYTNDDFTTDIVNLGGSTINPSDTDLTVRIKLNDPIFTSADSSFATNSDFQAFLNGLYISTDTLSAPGGMLYLDLYSSSTYLTLYYNGTDSFNFEMDAESAWTNRFHHNYAGTVIEAQLADKTLGETSLYVQPNEGVRVKLEMPYLTSWMSETKIAVNKAEIVLKVDDDGTLATYPVPDNLFILGAGDDVVITDQNEGATHFGGTYDAVSKSYSFNIARYVHEILHEGRSNDGMYLIIPNNLLTSGSVVSSNRVVLGGPKHPTLGLKLNLIYTEI